MVQRRTIARLAAAVMLVLAGGGLAAQELQVNTDTSGDQLVPAVASHPSGSFVVVWQTAREPGAAVPTTIRARRFGADGDPLGADFVVNSTTTGFHGEPSVAMTPGGGFVVAWLNFVDFFQPDTFDIRARRFAADGSPQGADFQVNTFVPGRQIDPAVAVLANGEFVIAWEGPGPSSIDVSDGDVQARRYSAGGAALGAEARVNSVTDGPQAGTSIAALPGNGYLISWGGESLGTDQSFGSVQARRFSAGGVPQGADFQVNTFTDRRQHKPAVAVGAGGEAVIAWQGEASAGSDHSLSSAHAQLFAAGGANVGPELQTNTITLGAQDEPAAAVGSDDAVLVAWHSLENPLVGNHQVRGRLIGLDGTPRGAEFPLNGPGVAQRGDVAVAALPAGDFVAVWSAAIGNGLAQIRARLLTGECAPGPTRLCLGDGRFQVETRWRTGAGVSGDGQAVQLTRDTGYFWFFRDTNVEMVLKVLDACAVNNRFWVFSAGLTNVEVDILVTDVLTGQTATYNNPLDRPFPPILDTNALAVCPGSSASAAEPSLAAAELEAGGFESESEVASLAGDPGFDLARLDTKGSDTFLLLNGGRFRISIDWQTGAGQSGQGHGVQLTADTGYFWFFNPNNVEVLLKVLNACGLNEHYWVFSGGLTNVRAVIRVEDTSNGTVKTYTNPQNTPFQPILDTSAFETCP